MKKKEYRHITIRSDESDDDIIFGTYSPELEITLDVAKELVDNRLDFTNGKSHYVVVDVNNIKSTTKEVREYMSDVNGGLKGILGGAFLSNSIVTTMVVNLYLRITKPPVPAKYFTKREDALNWLREIKKTRGY